MGWNFRKRIRIMPGVHLNVGKTGVSTSFGIKGLGITTGKSGTHFRAGIPGTGIYYRKKLDAKGRQVSNNRGSRGRAYESTAPELPDYLLQPVDIEEHYEELTCEGMRSLKELILAQRAAREEIQQDIKEVEADLKSTQVHLFYLSFIFFLRWIFPNRYRELQEDKKLQLETLQYLKEKLQEAYAQIEAEVDTDVKVAFEDLKRSFQEVNNVRFKWRMVSDSNDFLSYHNRGQQLSSSSITRDLVSFSTGRFSELKTQEDALVLSIRNKGKLYIYCGFVVIEYPNTFDIVDWRELLVSYQPFDMVEFNGHVSDAQRVGETYLYTNKDGSPDRRYKNNAVIPINRYGRLWLTTTTGLDESYIFSSYKMGEEFSLQLLRATIAAED